MMLGWGLRGFIGGGPFGAMIPGAMVALTLCWLYPRRDVAMLAAFAAVGVGFGGEMTYGQTVGFIVKADTFWWGLLGLALKGAIWGKEKKKPKKDAKAAPKAPPPPKKK